MTQTTISTIGEHVGQVVTIKGWLHNRRSSGKIHFLIVRDGTTTMKGFVVYDDASTAKRPGIIMVHEWWGITQHIHNEAKKYAAQGYTAFIADMYGDAKTADNPKDAGALSGGVMKDPKAMESRFNAAKAELARLESDHARLLAERQRAVGRKAYWYYFTHEPPVEGERPVERPEDRVRPRLVVSAPELRHRRSCASR